MTSVSRLESLHIGSFWTYTKIRTDATVGARDSSQMGRTKNPYVPPFGGDTHALNRNPPFANGWLSLETAHLREAESESRAQVAQVRNVRTYTCLGTHVFAAIPRYYAIYCIKVNS